MFWLILTPIYKASRYVVLSCVFVVVEEKFVEDNSGMKRHKEKLEKNS